MNHYNQPHYTLPGVMHYLQTEFTRNERDRITWDLERLEMKSYINKLESENRDLRHKLATISQSESNIESSQEDNPDEKSQIDLLMESRLKVQENVKEIIYLLNGPNITSDLTSITNRNLPLHEMEDLNLNTRIKKEQIINQDNMSPISNDSAQIESLFNNQKSMDDIQLGHLNKDPSYESNNNNNNHDKDDDDDDLQSDTTEVFPIDEETDLSIPIQDDIDDNNNIRVPQVLKVYKNNILATLNNKLKYYLIEEDSSCRDMNVSFDSILEDENDIKGIYWINERMVMFILSDGISVWNMVLNKLVKRFPLFNDLNLDYKDVISTDYKNKWLLLTTNTKVHIIEWDWNVDNDEDGDDIFVTNRYNVHVQRCMTSILGMTEKSFIVMVNNPFKLIIYNFNGEILQTVNMNKDVSKKRITNDVKLYLNKEGSKLLIQLKRHLIFYSFEQKRIVLQTTLSVTPNSIYFKYNNDIVGIGYSNGIVELRKLADFNKPVFHYPHLGASNDDSLESDSDKTYSTLIEATKLGDKHIFLSLGDNVLKLETADI